MNEPPRAYPASLTRAASYLKQQLESAGVPLVTPRDFYFEIWRMYVQAADQKLYLREPLPSITEYNRLKANLKTNGIIGADRDYGKRAIRLLAVPDLPADDIVCLIDPTAYIAHLSAMQRWGLTDRSSEALLVTRPDRAAALANLQDLSETRYQPNMANPFPLKPITHPKTVRQRQVHLLETQTAGKNIPVRGSHVRISTIGQTFLDMMQKPELCGGMSHVIDVWNSHARNFLAEIISEMNNATSSLVKSRAGYILDEIMGVSHPLIETWKAAAQRGGSRKLDPSKAFSSNYSETWMISINV